MSFDSQPTLNGVLVRLRPLRADDFADLYAVAADPFVWEQHPEIEIGWTFLARSHRGGRHNGEVKQLMLRHAFRFVASVVFFVSPDHGLRFRPGDPLGCAR
jgi:hypothetical protein